jgi:hypothetical protein
MLENYGHFSLSQKSFVFVEAIFFRLKKCENLPKENSEIPMFAAYVKLFHV